MRKIAAFAILALVSATFAAVSGLSSVYSAIGSLCAGLTQMLPVAAMLMIILAGVIYAAGQMMGAETRARANVWATAALTGALIAILISVVAPSVLNTIYNPTNDPTKMIACSNP